MKNTSRLLTAIVTGAATGALLGILFAPDKGRNTRKKISKKSRRFAEDLKDKLSEGKDKFNDIKEAVKEKIEEFA